MYVFLMVIGDQGLRTTGDLTLNRTLFCFWGRSPSGTWPLGRVVLGVHWLTLSCNIQTCPNLLFYYFIIFLSYFYHAVHATSVPWLGSLPTRWGRFLIARCIASWLSAYTARGAGISSPTSTNKSGSCKSSGSCNPKPWDSFQKMAKLCDFGFAISRNHRLPKASEGIPAGQAAKDVASWVEKCSADGKVWYGRCRSTLTGPHVLGWC